MSECMKESCQMIDQFVKKETDIFDRKQFFDSFLLTYLIEEEEGKENLEDFYEKEKEKLFELLGPYDFL
jgi:hypothetical protein